MEVFSTTNGNSWYRWIKGRFKPIIISTWIKNIYTIRFEQLLDVVDELEKQPNNYVAHLPSNIRHDYRRHPNGAVLINQIMIAVAIMVLNYPSRFDKFEMEIIAAPLLCCCWIFGVFEGLNDVSSLSCWGLVCWSTSMRLQHHAYICSSPWWHCN